MEYRAKSLEDIAKMFDTMADRVDADIIAQTLRDKAKNAGISYGYREAARVLRATTLETV